LGYPVLGQFSAMRDQAFVRSHAWFVAIGDNSIRCDLCHALADMGASFANVIHPSAQISRRATLGRGLYIGPCAVASMGSILGDWVIMGAQAYLGVEGCVGNGAFLGHGTILSGGTSIGARSFLGSGTIVSNDASVGDDCVVGASSLVIGTLPDATTAYGVPAKPAPLRRQPFRR
jgi:sugar O-acyltransferase (sialic acid O-acetyltransferase NeuD family)